MMMAADEHQATALARALLEVVNRRRPAEQLAVRVAPNVRRVLRGLASLYRGRPLHLASVRVQASSPAVLEVSLRVLSAGRSIPLAMRLRRRCGRWECTALETAEFRPRGRGSF